MRYETVVGLEIHVELSTKSKIYCSCSTQFGSEANTQICPVCVGMPGALPVLNKSVVEYAVRAGIATNCSITEYSKQDRKNYFYPDLPKAYQISQFDLPICTGGYVDIDTDGGKKRIGITRIHIEEDAGKLIHDTKEDCSLIDYNRAGIPLIEIVSEPDISSPLEAKMFVEELKAIIEYIGVSDCKMQEGSFRVDVNISVRPKGEQDLGVRTEMKNLNSIRTIMRAIEGERTRQIKVLTDGDEVFQETRRWDEQKGGSYPLRSKGEARDYRFFAEPDLMPIVVDQSWKDEIKNTLPELPEARRRRFVKQFAIPEYDALIITGSRPLADFFEEAVQKSKNAKAVSNLIMGELLRLLKDKDICEDEIPLSASNLAKLVNLVDEGVISITMAKRIFEKMFESNKDPKIIVKEEGLFVVNDKKSLDEIVTRVISKNPELVEDYRAGKTKVFGFLVGQAMKESKGKAEPRIINEILKAKLKGI